MLLDRQSANDRAVASRLNPQTRYGDDVISRIRFAGENPNGLQILHESIVQAINEMIDELCASSGSNKNEIGCISFSGNTTMQQLLCRIDTTSLGKVPFLPGATTYRLMPNWGCTILKVKPIFYPLSVDLSAVTRWVEFCTN
jgi:uncharacterized 2Fe-2S/4Fe-4S cluster protein (DUF4445 family)